MVIFIIGMPASGKTTIGRKLAKSLNMIFMDTDEKFERDYKISSSKYISEEGESRFRRLEEMIITNVSRRKDNLVVATGGGSVLSKLNRDIFHKNYTFYLREDNEVLKDRIKNTNRAFKDIDKIWNQRKVYYEEFENLILDANNYPILIGRNLLSILDRVNSTYFISDFFKDKDLNLKGEKIYVKSGEKLKTFDNLKKYYEKLFELERDRYSSISTVGGGSMGDFFGMLSGTFMRGIPFYMVPTTLLSMVDSSVGGKVGVNLGNVKNAIGMTNDPQLVVIDIDFLDSLSKEEFNSGMFEVFKCGFLRDESLFDKDISIVDVIYKSLKVKLHYVKIDYKDFGDRRFLNFGHTIGHAIELLTNIKHGEAVGYGMLCEIYLSYLNGLLSIDSFKQCINKIDLDILPKINVNPDEVIKMVSYDKKKIGNSINFTLLKDIANPVIYDGVEKFQIEKAIKKYVN